MIEPVFQSNCSRRNPANETLPTRVSSKHDSLLLLYGSKQETFKTSPSSYYLVSCGGCFFITSALLCPCVQRRKKPDPKELSFRAEVTSTSTSVSLNESSVSGSISIGSKTCAASPSKSLQKFQGGQPFTLAELSKATRNFSPTCKIGQGGFGAVYKGKLSDGTVVAIKRAKKKVYDPRVSNEFETEVQMLMNVDHLNLVKLIGYLEENEERILVVEYVPNGNLREHLDGAHGVVLDLGMRLDICIDVAHALTYLHMYAGTTIIHRDVKPSNILLTEKFRAKVADFGYSRMGPLEMGETHVSTQVKGTAGYLDPEYLKKFQLTEKSDVFSFGIVLLEIITGRKPIDEKREVKEKITSKWAFRKFLDGKIVDILDPRLEKSNEACMVVERIAELAFQCTAPTKQDRPCMKNVAEVLWNVRKNYQSLMLEREPATLEKKPPTLASLGRNSMPARSSQPSNIMKKLSGSQSCKTPIVKEGL
ncbi:hypothetical protein L7F22_053402 [Adiantum nelumboides]|nr:hypothetical protein [Adiantum nelumboides]